MILAETETIQKKTDKPIECCRQTIEDPDDLDVEVAEQKTGKTRQSRPPRSVLYYLKGYESTISLTPCQLPPRSRILQVNSCLISTYTYRVTILIGRNLPLT